MEGEIEFFHLAVKQRYALFMDVYNSILSVRCHLGLLYFLDWFTVHKHR